MCTHSQKFNVYLLHPAEILRLFVTQIPMAATHSDKEKPQNGFKWWNGGVQSLCTLEWHYYEIANDPWAAWRLWSRVSQSSPEEQNQENEDICKGKFLTGLHDGERVILQRLSTAIYPLEKVSTVAVWSMQLNASAVPAWGWGLTIPVGCWSSVHTERPQERGSDASKEKDMVAAAATAE